MSVPSPGHDIVYVSSATTRSTAGVTRLLLYVTILAGCSLFWISPRLPLCDLAQHAGQVALLRDLLAHQSPWASMVRINLFTPYLTGYGLALLLSYVMPVVTAMKVVLSVAYLAFIAGSMLLRRHFGGDERLDWLFVPGFFGFAFGWGMMTFLVATPIGLLFILLADCYASAASTRRAFGLIALGIVLFFSHGLVFLFACAVGLMALRLQHRKLTVAIRHAGPYVVLGLLAVCYAIVTYERDPLLALRDYLPYPDWGPLIQRPFNFVRLTLDADEAAFVDPVLTLFSLFLFAVPWLLGDRIHSLKATALAPMLVTVGVFLYVPGVAMKTAYLYQRMAIFVLPTYALMFRKPARESTGNRQQRDDSGVNRPVQVATISVLMAASWLYLGMNAIRLQRFAVESAPFETILNVMEPGQRALSLMFQTDSAAFQNDFSYAHYALWYQAERHGFVDMNFAWFLPQIVRFRSGQTPPDVPSWEFMPEKFNWDQYHARQYRYFIVRDSAPLPAGFFANRECDVRLVRQAAEWSLYERTVCR